MELSTSTGNQKISGDGSVVDDKKQAAKDTLHYIILTNEQQRLHINVVDGENIFSITLKIKNENTQIFANIDISQIVMYEFTNQEAPPLHPYVVKWNPNVTWGTADNPLIVNVIPFSISAPINNGTHIVLIKFVSFFLSLITFFIHTLIDNQFWALRF